MKALVIDTETSGLFQFKDKATGRPVPADAPGQPRLAQLGMIYADLDREEVEELRVGMYIEEAVERRNHSLDNPGFCTACGTDAYGCEPDAREYECEACGEAAVYGAEELLMELAL